MAKYRIVETTNSKDGETTYTVQERFLLIFWLAAQVQKDFGWWGDAVYYSLEKATELRNKLQFEASKRYTKKVL